MKKIMRNFLTFLFLFNNLSLVVQSESETMINDPQGRFSLKLGPGWVPEQIRDPHHFGKYAYVHGQNKAAYLAAGSETLPQVMSPLQYAQSFEQNLKSMPQYQRLQMNTVNLTGREAAYLQFSGVNLQTGNKLMFEVYILVFETTSYMIIFSTNADQYNTLKPVFDQIMQSIRYSSTASKPTESGITAVQTPDGTSGESFSAVPGRRQGGDLKDRPLTFNDPQGRLSLQLESGWAPLPLQQAGVLGRYHYGQNELEQLVIRTETLPQALPPLQYLEKIVAQEGMAEAPQYQRHQATTVNLVGQEAAYLRFSFVANTPQGETPLMCEMYFLVLQNTGYVIAFSARDNQYNTLKPVFGQVLQSIRYGTTPVQNPAPATQIQQQGAAPAELRDAKIGAVQEPQIIVEEGQGILHIELPDWIEGVPYYYKILKMSDGTEVAQIERKLQDTKLPAESYKIVWRQNQMANDEVLVAENVEIKSGQTTVLKLNTGFRIVPANWVPGIPYYWALKNPEKNIIINVSKSLKPELVRPGKYELWYRQNQRANDETRLATSVEVKPGELAQFELNTGFRIIPADWVPGAPYSWTLRDPSQNVEIRISQTLDPQLVPPGKYDLWYRQNQRANDETRLASSIEIKPGERIAFDLNTGIKLVPTNPTAKPPYSWVVTDLATNEKVLKVSNTWDPQPISPGRYKLGVRQTQNEQLTEKVSDFEIQAGNLVEKKI